MSGSRERPPDGPGAGLAASRRHCPGEVRPWRRTGGAVAAAVSGLIDLMLPLRCAGCGHPGTGWCAGCAREVGGLRKVLRELPVPPGESAAMPPVFTLGRYRGAARRAVVSYKVAGRRDLAEPFGVAMADGVEGIIGWDPAAAGPGERAFEVSSRSADGTWHLVPAPSRAITSRRRGGAHMTRVADRAAAVLADRGRAAEVADCLVAGSGTRDSVGLAPPERLGNLAGRLSVRPWRAPPAGAAVLLIDDVLTTGATVMSSAHALARHGVPVTAVLVLTATSG